MERMGDILARTATRRANQATQANPARPDIGNGEGAAPTAMPRDGARPDAARPAAPRRPATGTPRGPLARGGRVPARLPLASDMPRPGRLAMRPDGDHGERADLRETPPGATRATSATDVRAASDERILELPARYTTRAAPAARAEGDAPPAAARPTPLRPPTRRGLEPPAPGLAAAPTSAARGGAAPRASRANAGRAVCPYCGGAGYVRNDLPVGEPGFGRPVPCVCKERELKEKRRADIKKMGSLDAFPLKTFETFDPAIPGLSEAFKVARKFAADPQGWLVLSGQHGVGKTHLAAAIANEQMEAGNVVFFSIVPDLLDHLRAAFSPASDITYDKLFEDIREASLVVLDDLGSENSTAWATEKLFQLINHRYNHGMPMVITTNAQLISHMDERIRSRLTDISLTRYCRIEAQDYRARHVDRARRPGGAQGGPRAR